MDASGERRAMRKCAVYAAALACCWSAAARPAKAPADAWKTAVAAREVFEAAPPHSKVEYARVMDGFRAIYHANPSDAHAAASIAQVAELLAEQGRELDDAKARKDAAAQYAFLAKEYPESSLAKAARAKVAEGKVAEAKPGVARKSAAAVRSGDEASLSEKRDPSAGSGQVVGHPTVVPVETVAPSRDAHLSDDHAVAKMGHPVSSESPTARVTAIRHWSTPTYTRVAIDLGDEVQYQAARVEHPDRIFFDLHHAKLAPELVGRSFAITDDGFLTKIRAAQFSDDVTRVVLDVHEVSEYSAFLLPNPYRLIIDIHGKKKAEGPGFRAQVSEDGAAPVESPVSRPVSTPEKAAAASSLPPMPVTDGSAGFGLPVAGAKTPEGAQPRVVIPVKPTTARPVPNTTASKSASNGTDVAAVSEQPGKVEATVRPTSRPIAERAQGPGSRVQKTRAEKEEMASPGKAAPPTAGGETLLRALGLKIGRIVIDAGHGGHDSGTLGVDGIQEKDVVLDVALRLGKLLHQRLGAEIVYTRADDTFIPLETRTAIANKAQADLFISVHANSSQEPSARGVEVYYLNFTSDPEAMRVASRENAVSTKSVHELSDLVKKITLKDKIDESRELAADVEDSLFAGLTRGNEGLRNRGVKKAPFVVLIGANMPSILAEISFLTNLDDAEQLHTPEYRERVAESLFAGVARYAGGVNGKPPMMKVASKARAQGPGPRVQGLSPSEP